jgi:hypothetical protein
MSDQTANHRPLDQDPELDDDGTLPAEPWDGLPLLGEQIGSASPF